MFLKLRGGTVNLLFLAQESSRGLLFHEGFRDKAMVIKAKARSRLLASRADDMFLLPSAWTYETELPLEAGIPRLWDTAVPVISGRS